MPTYLCSKSPTDTTGSAQDEDFLVLQRGHNCVIVKPLDWEEDLKVGVGTSEYKDKGNQRIRIVKT